MTNKNYILLEIRRQKSELFKLGIVKIGLFGSYVRENQTGNSDIDILIEFEPEK